MSKPFGERSARVATVAALACAIALTVLAVLVAVHWRPLMHLDNSVARASNTLVVDHPAVRRAARATTLLGSYLVVDVVTVAVATVLALTRRVRLAIVVVVVRVGELAGTNLIKWAIHRPRPSGSVVHAFGSSFPSGHAAGAAAVYGVIAVVLVHWTNTTRRGGVAAETNGGRRNVALTIATVSIAALIALAVAASRVLLVVHFPSDVVGGLLLGAGWLAVCFVGASARTG